MGTEDAPRIPHWRGRRPKLVASLGQFSRQGNRQISQRAQSRASVSRGSLRSRVRTGDEGGTTNTNHWSQCEHSMGAYQSKRESLGCALVIKGEKERAQASFCRASQLKDEHFNPDPTVRVCLQLTIAEAAVSSCHCDFRLALLGFLPS